MIERKVIKTIHKIAQKASYQSRKHTTFRTDDFRVNYKVIFWSVTTLEM